MAKFGFDIAEVEVGGPAVSADPIPDGEYILRALEAEEKLADLAPDQEEKN